MMVKLYSLPRGDAHRKVDLPIVPTFSPLLIKVNGQYYLCNDDCDADEFRPIELSIISEHREL